MGATASISLRESFGSSGPGIKPNREAGVIPGVKIVGFESKNKRRYLPEALRRALPMYEGATVYVDHPKDDRADRSYTERFGTLKNVHMGESGLYGDLHYKKAHPLAESVLEDVENDTKGIGLSPNHYGNGPIRDGVRIVENISRVRSVDIVDNPATNHSFRESENLDVELQEQLNAANGQVAELTKENARLSGEVASLKESVAKFEAAQKAADHKAAVLKLLDDAKLPAAHRTKYVLSFLESLSADDAAKEVRSLAEAAAKPESAGPRHFKEGAGDNGGKSSDANVKTFVASIT